LQQQQKNPCHAKKTNANQSVYLDKLFECFDSAGGKVEFFQCEKSFFVLPTKLYL
jgi:hypothetical protein